MTIQEYLDKNLPNLNWNILPQIFEENGVEISEEAEAYLKNTPENTNWNVLKQMSEAESQTMPVVYVVRNNVIDTEVSDLKTVEEVITYVSNNYELVPTENTSSGYRACIKQGCNGIQFYANNNKCIIDDLTVENWQPISSISEATLKFSTETDSDYGVRVVISENDLFIYDNRE